MLHWFVEPRKTSNGNACAWGGAHKLLFCMDKTDSSRQPACSAVCMGSIVLTESSFCFTGLSNSCCLSI